MAPTSRLGAQIAEIIAALDAIRAPFALIGGLALASHHVIRATQDVDLLVAAEDADRVDTTLAGLGYQRSYRSADAANYLRRDERVDLLYASRPIARKLLLRASARTTTFGNLKVVDVGGLIGLKLQGFINDPRRMQDQEDIRALLRANRATINMTEVREYFRLFDREPLLDEILRTLG